MNNILNCTGHELLIPNIVNSDGVYLYDSHGKQYMDLESGVWCTALGHNHKRINNVLKDQIKRIMHAGFCYSNTIVDEAAHALLQTAHFDNGKCVFLSSGSEAIEIVRQVSSAISDIPQKTLTLHDAYLGSYSNVINREKSWYSFDWEKCDSCPTRNRCNPACEKLQRIPEDISEFIFEPGSASGFVRFPPKPLIKTVADIIRRNNGKIIVNEVTTGIGRTGKWFGYQHYDIKPDMIAVGKGIGNGYPVSAALFNQETAYRVALTHFSYMQGHQNDPLGAAIAKEVIHSITDDNLIENTQKMGKIFYNQLKSLIDKKVILEIRGKGLMFAIEIANKELTEQLYKNLIDNGYIVCNRGSFLRIDPPLYHH